MERVDSLNSYFELLDDILAKETWEAAEEAAKLLSIRDEHASYSFLQKEKAEIERRTRIRTVFDEITCFHLTVLYHISHHKYEAAFDTHAQMIQIFNKEILQKEKDMNWFMPIFYLLCTELRLIARAADLKPFGVRDPEKSSYYEQSATFIMECYRTCVTDVRASMETSKKVAMLNLTNQLFRIYFRINKLNLLVPLIRAIENCGALYNHFSMADKVTYNYYLGRKAMFDSDLVLAEKSLSYAFRNCLPECTRNKRLILMYLIPVKMFLGHMPSSDLLKTYQLEQFSVVVESVKDGNLKRLDEALQENEHFFIECGIFLMLEKLKIITFRNLFKKVANIVGKIQIPLDAFMIPLHWMGLKDIDDDELECIMANLIAQKKVKGYISHQHRKLVISKQTPFPSLSAQ
uniref:PCI domain-containing protein 2 homolog n=1 Tax=Syphacia muris TaxID=451379 RepID=A0A0N5ANJ2_9BILA